MALKLKSKINWFILEINETVPLIYWQYKGLFLVTIWKLKLNLFHLTNRIHEIWIYSGEVELNLFYLTNRIQEIWIYLGELN